MRHFPIFLDTKDQKIVVSGAGDVAEAKLRLLLKTQATISVFGENPASQIKTWADQGKITLAHRAVSEGDLPGATLLYAANDDAVLDAGAAKLARAEGVLVNVVDNLEDSQFITPAIVDRAPVTVAIGTEGAAPVLARKIKQQLEEALPATLGKLARIGQSFRAHAEVLPMGRLRRDFWSNFYFDKGPIALAQGGEYGAQDALETLLAETLNQNAETGFVSLVGAGPGDPELLTLKARNLLHEADVVIHDQLVSAEILELARREAVIVETGKQGFGPSWKQDDINALMIEHAQRGHKIVRLKSGDPAVFGRLDEELDALAGANISHQIVPGITAASAAATSIGQSLTKRGRNSQLRVLTGHDINGFAAHDWRDLAQTGTVAAIYMGKQAAKYLRGRLLMHGADGQTPITLIENASRNDQRTIKTTVLNLPESIEDAHLKGPAVILLGLAPRAALDAFDALKEVEHA